MLQQKDPFQESILYFSLIPYYCLFLSLIFLLLLHEDHVCQEDFAIPVELLNQNFHRHLVYLIHLLLHCPLYLLLLAFYYLYLSLIAARYQIILKTLARVAFIKEQILMIAIMLAANLPVKFPSQLSFQVTGVTSAKQGHLNILIMLTASLSNNM